MNKQNGIVANWNEGKGFGFIDSGVGDRMILLILPIIARGMKNL